MDTAALRARVPDYREFPTLAEIDRRTETLVLEFPGLARREVVGRSAEGRPIELLSIGHGRRSVLLAGVPHPNEPIGTLTLDVLCRGFCEDDALRAAMDVTLHVIPVADPDGFVLNEGWFKGTFSPGRYALDFYRPPHRAQVEWSFPVAYKTLRFSTPSPETATLMRVMERTRPAFFCALHNAAFCGVYFYASEERPALFSAFRDLVAQQGLPLHRGEPEVPYLRRLAPGVFSLFGIDDTYEYLARTLGADPAPHIDAGTCSDDWLKRVSDAFSLVCELPYFTTPALEDEAPAGCSRREALREGLAEERRLFEETAAAFSALGGAAPDHRLTRSVRDYLAKTPVRLDAEAADIATPPYDREATGAELVDATVCRVFHHLPYRGEVLRVAELMGVGASVAHHRERVQQEIDALGRRVKMEVLPLPPLVTVQAGSVLLALESGTQREG